MSTLSHKKLRMLELTINKGVESAVHGDRAGTGLGLGGDREEIVQYQPGHDVRLIDWNATARAGEPRVWLTRAQHALETWILLDQSPSMAFGTTDAEKLDVATWISAAFAILGSGASESVGVGLSSAAGLQWLPPRSGRSTAHRLLAGSAPPRSGLVPVSFAESLRQLASRAPRPGLRVVVSDLLDPAGDGSENFAWEGPLRRLAARHDVVVIEVIDPRELELPNVGELLLVDPETGSQRHISTSDQRLRHAYAQATANHHSRTASVIRASGASHMRLGTGDDLGRSLERFLRRRRLAPRRPTRRVR